MAEKENITQSEAAIDAIIKYITEQGLKPGDKLPSEREFAEIIGVGRPAVREAARALNVVNIIEVRQQDGMYVASAAEDTKYEYFRLHMQAGKFDMAQLYELRMILETACIGMAAKRITQDQLQELEHVITATSVDDPEGFGEADRRMHEIIYESTGNQLLRQLMRTVGEWTVISRKYTNPHEEVRKIVYYDHLNICKALQSRDEMKCIASMQRHIQHLEKIEDINQNAMKIEYSKLLNNGCWEYVSAKE